MHRPSPEGRMTFSAPTGSTKCRFVEDFDECRPPTMYVAETGEVIRESSSMVGCVGGAPCALEDRGCPHVAVVAASDRLRGEWEGRDNRPLERLVRHPRERGVPGRCRGGHPDPAPRLVPAHTRVDRKSTR